MLRSLPRGATSAKPRPNALRHRALKLFHVLELWLYRLRSRKGLADLTPEQMRDVGLNPAVVRREVEKPFWMA